tara:strand:+ start:1260 stop:1490 length:231 start_codon:yes stop_codon:yes gene_type:complete
MSQENEEIVMLLKALVDKVKSLEEAVYHKDNLLMKSGYVVVDSPTPQVGNKTTAGLTSAVGDMKWDDIHKMVGGMQ